MHDHEFPVAGIGASAGGVEALQTLFQNMPDNVGIGFVVVTHLSPDRESLLHEIIARCTKMPVHVATDGAKVERDNVYVLPANALLGFENGCLRLTISTPPTRERKPIDYFLSALAKDKSELAIGVILSGADSDGTLGSKAIKERGGLTLAQIADGKPPRNPEMPDSAILTGMVDFATPVDEMGDRLLDFTRSLGQFGDAAGDANGVSDNPQAADRAHICALLRNQTGHDFEGYKPKTFWRRVQRRMQVSRLSSLEAYIDLLLRDPKEVSALFRDLLISVTNFFRDAEAFEALEKLVILKLFEGRGADDTVRVWVPGCATGEEVFSIGILMREHMSTLRNVPRVQIFATDIDDSALNVARAARYPEALLDGVSNERRERFFTRDGGSYVVTKDVRDFCIFSPHSVLRDPPFSHIDLVSCRNLLIYFGPEAQNQVIPAFRYSLRTGGYLFLGTSENISQFRDILAPVDKKSRIFRARDDGAAPARLSLPGLRWPGVVRSGSSPRQPFVTPLRQTVEAHVLERHAPPHVVVTADGDVVFYSARTGKYFEAPAGAPNRQLLPMARKGMRLDLRGVMHEAVNSGRAVSREAVEFEREDGRVQLLTLMAEPLPGSSNERLFLITFNDGPVLSVEDAAHRSRRPQETNEELERELRETRERLQSMIEEYETALEELKSSNEEMLSVNEEMQSTNEELEASKEELQSLNEELQTVNIELNIKVEALDHANSDLQNLFESTEVATIFLDEELTIRMFTPAAAEVFKILPTDIGRPITDLTSRLVYPEISDDLISVHASGKVVERQIDGVARDAHYIVRVSAYRDSDGQAGGVVVTVIDVSGLAQAELRQRTLIAELNHRVKNMLAVVLALGNQTKRGAASLDAFYETFIGRIGSMSRSYELLSRESWTTVRLEDVLRQELEPFGEDRVTLAGDPLLLTPRQGLSMGMVLHELATNAAKFGAFAHESGRLAIDWKRDQAGDAAQIGFQWKETVDDEIKPAKAGFGLKLVEQEISYNLGGSAEIAFEPDGLLVRLRFDEDQARSDAE